jgi:hypothetical protein
MIIEDLTGESLVEAVRVAYALASDEQVAILDRALADAPGTFEDAQRACVAAALELGIVTEADILRR